MPCQWLLNCLNSPEDGTTVEKFEEFTKKARTVCEADPESFDNDVLFKSISLSCLDDNPEQGMKKERAIILSHNSMSHYC